MLEKMYLHRIMGADCIYCCLTSYTLAIIKNLYIYIYIVRENGGNYKMKSIIIVTFHRTLFEQRSHGG